MSRLRNWDGESEPDLYPYVKDVFCNVFGYPRRKARIERPGESGRPDISLCPSDADPNEGVFWIVGEVKPEKGRFMKEDERHEVWEDQLKKYVTADTVYALLIDPTTVAVLRPDGTEVKVVDLEETTVEDLVHGEGALSLEFLTHEASVSDVSLDPFKQGLSPSRYLDVREKDGREKFYSALRLSSRELIDYAAARLSDQLRLYSEYTDKLREINESAVIEDEVLEKAREDLRSEYLGSVKLAEAMLPEFETLIGRQMPTKEEEAKRFVHDVYATEGSSLVLARVLFVRFCEDHGLTTRKISNGGIRLYREFFQHLKDDYRKLLLNAYDDVERVYGRLFEPSIFDWTHEGDGALSRILLRTFYRMNAFDFTHVTGDVLGNLYERFLDPAKRKRVGEYYTPIEVAEYVLERIGFYENPGKILDPACGSGTFLIAAATGLIERLLERGVSREEAVRQALGLVHGLDINVFAAFIAQLQLLWHLFPYLEEVGTDGLPDLNVYGGLSSLVYHPQRTLQDIALRKRIGEVEKVRDARYRYVVGNPPYIRNERLKDRGEWRDFYAEVDYRNSDIAFFFVQRALFGGTKEDGGKMPPWLEKKGRLCFVLPVGIGDSAAAERLRERILENRLLEVTDLEEVAVHIFPSPQASSRATVVPMLLFVESAKGGKEESVEVTWVKKPSMREEDVERSQVAKSTFVSAAFNPYRQILTKVRKEDIAILEKLYKHPLAGAFAAKPAPMYGIKKGGKGVIYDSPRESLLPVFKGQNVSTFYLHPRPSGWVDLESVESRSIWGHENLLNVPAYALSEIGLTCHSCIFNPEEVTFNNSAVLFVPDKKGATLPWDVLFNSSLARFIHLLTLRTGLISDGTSAGGGRIITAKSHIYPRVVSAFPVPTALVDDPSPVVSLAEDLRATSQSIGARWDDLDSAIAEAEKESLPLLGVNFTGWQDTAADAELRIVQENGAWRLRAFLENQATLSFLEGPYAVLNLAGYLIETEEIPPVRSKLERLNVPREADLLSEKLDQARDPESADISRFKDLHTKTDILLAELYGLEYEELEQIWARLSKPPLDLLIPRWPWIPAQMRAIKSYEGVDRFA
ncbi:MAG: N-6 DNA methylase [Thermoplasmata archaeon]